MTRPDPTGPVLVVEDDEDSRMLLSTLLSVLRYRAVTAANGEEGLAMARRHHPRLILLDLMMPVLDGEEFRRQQLRDDSIKDIPVLVVSARHDCDEVARKVGAAACLQKPINFEELARQIAAACEES